MAVYHAREGKYCQLLLVTGAHRGLDVPRCKTFFSRYGERVFAL